MYGLEHEEGDVVTIVVRDRLTDEDYELLRPDLEAAIERHGTVRLVWDMVGFDGWTPGALWQDAKFDIRHNDDVTRIAMIGDTRWQAWMTAAMKPFAHADVRYFDSTDREAAYTWVRDER